MPSKKSAIRRKIPVGPITGEQIETLITGDWEHGALIPRLSEFAGSTFHDLEHARLTWRRNWRLILRIHRLGWQAADGEPTSALQSANWQRYGEPCWAETEFGLPHGAKTYLKGLSYQRDHPAAGAATAEELRERAKGRAMVERMALEQFRSLSDIQVGKWGGAEPEFREKVLAALGKSGASAETRVGAELMLALYRVNASNGPPGEIYALHMAGRAAVLEYLRRDGIG